MEVIDLLLIILVTLPRISHGDTFGDTCKKDQGQCKTRYNLKCGSNNTCTCIKKEGIRYVRYDKMPKACVHPDQATGERGYLERCKHEGCSDPLFCDLDSRSPVCKCPPMKPNWSEDYYECQIKGPGSECDPNIVANQLNCASDLVCERHNRTCQCSSTRLQWDADDGKCVVAVGEDCFAGEQYALNAECSAGKCVCVTNYYAEASRLPCNVRIVPIGGKCKVKEDCLPRQGMDCVDNQCSCAAGSAWVDGGCKAHAAPPTCDPSAKVDACVGSVQDLACNANQKVCACHYTSVYSQAAHACKIKGGASCTVLQRGGTAEHGLCYSGYCIEATYTGLGDWGTCACEDGQNGQRRIWRSDPPGCVDDKFGFPCSKDQDCALPKAKAGRKGFSCHIEENRCLCDTGYTYQGAYCVKDKESKGHGASCSLEGYPGCNVKAGLACRNVNDTGYKCLCSPKPYGRPFVSNRHYVSLEWDATQGKCALKGAGRHCGQGFECRGRRCVKGICEGSGVTVKLGVKVVASAYAGVTLLLTSDLVLRSI